ncbi:hypothetical protein H6F67_11910 [Microcoleus sp. FACHB-1515]|uniref:hypothetical protein n=1 Tax=Cyanophyceae TaxID=3028117 RepID=UPI0016864989|nr:hypothetical protein [Microcoleus sp. FACHB-1515]MBD2090559.1 hypothetical protein [Microcoleus sp. FACHB-1515]
MQGSDNISTCRHCRHYQLEGRRGGNCQQLGALVQGRWKACSLAVPAFVRSWEQEEMQAWKLEAVELAESCFSVSQSTLSSTAHSSTHAKNFAKEKEAEPRSIVPISAIVLSQRKAFPLAPTA